MSSRARIALVLPLAAALASAALADTDAPAQTRATIRGTGKDVSIVYRGVSSATPRRGAADSPADVVGEAARLAERGADEQSLIRFFRAHQDELPTIVGADAVRRLRKAGAGPAVISDLSRMTALDIGETAEGAPVQNAYAYEGPAPPSGDMGYPFYGSYGGYGSAGFAPRHAHGRAFGFGPPRHSTLPARPAMPGRPPMHGGSTHAGMPRFPQP